MAGLPPKQKLLFLGDYVDRGFQGVECVFFLFAHMLKYPGNCYLLRGNHECSNINRVYGFYDECQQRFSTMLYKAVTACFNYLPMAAIVSESIYCVHGGLSPELRDINDIDSIARPTDVPDEGLLCDMVWSDPSQCNGWTGNDRGVSYCWGEDVVEAFLDSQDLDLVVRSHQVVEDGYDFFADRRVVTLFSAPNYCGQFDNAAAIMSVGEGE